MAEINYQVVKKPLEERILDAACIYFDVSPEFFKIKEKNGDTDKRYTVFYMLMEYGGMTRKDIAERFYYHKSSMYEGIANIEGRINIYPSIARNIREINAIATNLDAELVTVSVKLHTKSK